MAINLSMGANEKDSPPQKVRIKPTETGAIINAYKNNPEYGYVYLESDDVDANGEVIPHSLRTALLRAEVSLLEKFIQAFGKGGSIPGRIVVKEFVESEVPENYMSRLNKNLAYHDAVAPYVKRAGKYGGLLEAALTLGGERILRFTDYDGSGNVKDELILNTLTATQLMEQNFEDTRFKPLTYEDVGPFSKRTSPTQITQDKSPSAFTEKTNQSDVKVKDRFFTNDMTLWDYVQAVLTIIVLVVGGILLLGEALGLINSGSSNEWRRP